MYGLPDYLALMKARLGFGVKQGAEGREPHPMSTGPVDNGWGKFTPEGRVPKENPFMGGAQQMPYNPWMMGPEGRVPKENPFNPIGGGPYQPEGWEPKPQPGPQIPAQSPQPEPQGVSGFSKRYRNMRF